MHLQSMFAKNGCGVIHLCKACGKKAKALASDGVSKMVDIRIAMEQHCASCPMASPDPFTTAQPCWMRTGQ